MNGITLRKSGDHAALPARTADWQQSSLGPVREQLNRSSARNPSPGRERGSRTSHLKHLSSDDALPRSKMEARNASICGRNRSISAASFAGLGGFSGLAGLAAAVPDFDVDSSPSKAGAGGTGHRECSFQMRAP